MAIHHIILWYISWCIVSPDSCQCTALVNQVSSRETAGELLTCVLLVPEIMIWKFCFLLQLHFCLVRRDDRIWFPVKQREIRTFQPSSGKCSALAFYYKVSQFQSWIRDKKSFLVWTGVAPSSGPIIRGWCPVQQDDVIISNPAVCWAAAAADGPAESSHQSWEPRTAPPDLLAN